MPKSQIIVLNGTSSAGKTTLARAIQAVAKQPYQLISFDQFRDGLPPRYRGLNSPHGSTGALGLNVVAHNENGMQDTLIQLGAHGANITSAMHEAIRGFAKSGERVVVDHFVNEKQIADNMIEVLAEFHPVYVSVRCDLNELERREKLRPGRFPGTAAAQCKTVYACMRYDFELDTTNTPATQLASQLLSQLNTLVM